jgi:hypothetical protein
MPKNQGMLISGIAEILQKCKIGIDDSAMLLYNDKENVLFPW